MDGHVIDTRIEVKRPISSEEGNRLTPGGGMSLLTKQMSEIKRAVGMYAYPRRPHHLPDEFDDDGSLHDSTLLPDNGLWILVRATGSLVSDKWVRRRRMGGLF